MSDYSSKNLSLEEIKLFLTLNKKAGWENTLIDVLDLVQIYFLNEGLEQVEADKYAIGVVMVLSDLIGGQQLYFPMGERLESAIRNYSIYQDLGKLDIVQLARKYKLSQRQIYNICAEQRAFLNNRKSENKGD